MAEQELRVTVQFERHRFENASGDVVILSGVDEAGNDVSLKGPATDDGPELRTPYRFYGYWSKYRDQPQFVFKSFTLSATPAGRDAIVAYLSKAPRLGRALASRLYESYGEGAVEALRTEPVGVAERTLRLSESHAIEASKWLEKNYATERVTIALVGLLDKGSFPSSLVGRLIKKFGNRAPDIIHQNPYRLMEFKGVSFPRADALYLKLGKNPRRLKRQALCCTQAVVEARNGDTWVYGDVARKAVAAQVAGSDPETFKAIRLAIRAGLLRSMYTDGPGGEPDPFGDCLWLATAEKGDNEQRLANVVNGMTGEGAWSAVAIDKCSDHQAEEIERALIGRLGILCGGPGTGKTYVVAQLVKAIKAARMGSVAIVAPTGKAAVRCTEAMSEYDIDETAKTIHSLLGVAQVEDGGWEFIHGPGFPLPFRFYIVDEASMVDTDLACRFFEALPPAAHVLLVGDTGQLLPVGHGAPLRDLIAAGVPCGTLTEIRRNSGAIVEACHAISRGESFECGGNLESYGHHVSLVELLGLAPVDDVTWDIQVVTAVNEKSPFSRHSLNQELQSLLNKSPAIDGMPFRLNDKVVNLSNGWFGLISGDVETNQDGECYVANGEIGCVSGLRGRTLEVSLFAPARKVRVPVGKATPTDRGCNWDLAYALSVHKSQGSEFPCVIACLDDSPAANQVCDRAWVYTAISRAKQHCILWGDMGIAAKYCGRDRIAARRTNLRTLVESWKSPSSLLLLS